MTFATPLARLARRFAAPGASRTERRVRTQPLLEALEDRSLPSVVIDSGHIDVSINYDLKTGWDLHVHDDTNDVDYDASDALFYAGPNCHTFQPDDPRFAFLGAGPGGDVWIMPQSFDPDKIYLGFGLDGVDPGTFDTYFNTDPRVNQEGEWIKTTLLDVRGPGQFSVWQTDASGNPIVWMSTYDPNSQENAIYNLPGGDNHTNWGFTSTGVYQVDFQASAYIDGVLTCSDVVTYNFGIEDTGGFGGGPSTATLGSHPAGAHGAAPVLVPDAVSALATPLPASPLPAAPAAGTLTAPAHEAALDQVFASTVTQETAGMLPSSPATTADAQHSLTDATSQTALPLDSAVTSLTPVQEAGLQPMKS